MGLEIIPLWAWFFITFAGGMATMCGRPYRWRDLNPWNAERRKIRAWRRLSPKDQRLIAFVVNPFEAPDSKTPPGDSKEE